MSQYDSEGLKLLPIDEYMNIFQAAPDVITKQPPTQVDTCPIWLVWKSPKDPDMSKESWDFETKSVRRKNREGSGFLGLGNPNGTYTPSMIQINTEPARFSHPQKETTIVFQASILRGYMDVSKNNGTAKSSILIGFSIMNHPFWGTPIFGNHPYIVSFRECKPLDFVRIHLWDPPGKKRVLPLQRPKAGLKRLRKCVCRSKKRCRLVLDVFFLGMERRSVHWRTW